MEMLAPTATKQSSESFQMVTHLGRCIGHLLGTNFHVGVPGFSGGLTWRYHSDLKKGSHDYGYVLSGGKNIALACPDHLKLEFEASRQKLESHFKALKMVQMPVTSVPLFECLPRAVYVKYLKVCDEITRYTSETTPKPSNYSFLCSLHEFLVGIQQIKLKVDLSAVRKIDKKSYLILNKSSDFVDYNMFGTRTGRLTTNPGSFPILNLKKDLRCVLKPKNDFFIEIDFNAAELRVMLSLMDKAQPEIDVHEYNAKNIFRCTREEAKRKVFSWLYDLNKTNKKLENYYERENVIDSNYNGVYVETPMGRRIDCDRRRALSYLLQSTSSDILLERCLGLEKMLTGLKSRISFVMHDCVVLDFSKDDFLKLREIKLHMCDTALGKFKVNVKIGTDYGNMKKIEI